MKDPKYPLKLVLKYTPMFVLTICSHQWPLGMKYGHFGCLKLDFGDFRQFLTEFDPNLTIFLQ